MDNPESELLDYQAILRGIARRHRLFMAMIFVTLAVPMLTWIYLTHQETYLSTATVAIEYSSLLDQLTGLNREGIRRDSFGSHMVLLRSRSVSEAVVDALPKESFDELLAYAQYRDYKLTLINTVKGWLSKPPTVLSPKQRAIAEVQNARIDFSQSRDAPGTFIITASASQPRVAMDLVNTYIQILLGRTRSSNQEEARKSREFLEAQIQQAKENLQRADETMTKFEQQKGRIKLGSQTDLDLMKLSQAESALAEAQASQQVVAARIASLRRLLEQARVRDAKPESSSREREASSAGPSPDEMTARMASYRAAHEQLLRIEGKLAQLRERYTDAYPLVQVTQDEVAAARARVTQLARELPVPGPQSDSRPQAPPAVAPPSADRADAQRQLAALETEEAALQAKVANLQTQADRLRKSLRTLSQEELEFSNLRRAAEGNRNLLSVLSDKLMTARIQEQGESSVIRIIDPASFPVQPSPDKLQRLLLMVLAAAAGISFVTAFGIEFWKQPVETDSDVRKATGLHVLGHVGTLGIPTGGRKGTKKGQPSLLPVYLPGRSSAPSIHMELYRAIRASIETERLKTPFHTILVTSPGPNEGKSTTILNLAHVFHEFKRRVLIVEADLRRPTLQRALSVSNKPDIADFLRGAATFEQVCHLLPSGVTMIPGQVVREDAASMLGSPRFKELLEQAYSQFDVVLVDSPPLLAVPDNLLLVTAIDRVILVVKASVTSKRDLRKAQAMLKQTKVEILGVILNQAHPRDVDYYQPRYRKYYRSTDSKSTPETPRRSGLSSWGKRK